MASVSWSSPPLPGSTLSSASKIEGLKTYRPVAIRSDGASASSGFSMISWMRTTSVDPSTGSTREQHGEGLVADVVAGHRHRVAEAERLALADERERGELGDGPDLRQLLLLALLLELLLELGQEVEVVLDRLLGPPRDDADVVDPGGDRLLDHILDRRLVDDGQHLLRRGLRRRKEAGAEACRGDDGFADGTGHRLTSMLRGQAVRVGQVGTGSRWTGA